MTDSESRAAALKPGPLSLTAWFIPGLVESESCGCGGIGRGPKARSLQVAVLTSVQKDSDTAADWSH